MSAPAFSIILPTYNRAHMIGGTIGAVQAQTMPDWELIVIDDGSTDDTLTILRELQRGDDRIKILANTGFAGPGGARNTGLRVAKAEYIAFLDSDDHWEPGILETYVTAWRRDPDAVMIGADCRFADETSTARTMTSYLFDIILPWWKSYPLAAAVIPVDQIRNDIHVICQREVMVSMAIAGFLWLNTSVTTIRRDAAFTAGLFDERLVRAQDIDLWLKLNQLGRVVYLNEVLATYDIVGRRHGDGHRYESYHRSRRHTAYIEAWYHLHSLDFIARSSPLTAEQWRLLEDRRIAHHHRCAVAGLREWRLAGVGHLVWCLASSKKEREDLRKRPAFFFHLP